MPLCHIWNLFKEGNRKKSGYYKIVDRIYYFGILVVCQFFLIIVTIIYRNVLYIKFFICKSFYLRLFLIPYFTT